jgi:hypothetical protein
MDIRYIFRAENSRANDLAQEASGYRIMRWKFHVYENPIVRALNSQVTDHPTPSHGPSAIVSNRLVVSHGPSNTSRGIALIDSVNNTTDEIDWRTPLITYLCNPSVKTDSDIRWIVFKYVFIDGELYYRTPSDSCLSA